MASSYTTNTGIEKPATGEQSGTWGDTTNTNFDIIDRLASSVGDISLSGTTHTLTTSDGALSEGHYKVLVLGGSPSGTNTITISPNDQEKMYLVFNNSGEDAIFTQGSGGNVTVPNGNSKIIYSDGAGSGAAVTDFTGTLDVDLKQLSINGTEVTATAAELNIMDGVTATASELNIMDGVTATTSELNILDGVTASTSEINILDGVTATTNEINFVDGVTSNIQSQLDNIVTTPAGVVSAFAGGTAPSGWLLCYGQAVNRNTYSALFTAIGTTFGAGDGSTTFNLPDLRGRAVAGVDDMGGSAANRLTDATENGVDGDLGDSGGSESHTLATIEMPSHTHGITNMNVRYSNSGGHPGQDNVINANANNEWNPNELNRETIQGSLDNAGGGAAHNNVQPTLVLNYIIKT